MTWTTVKWLVLFCTTFAASQTTDRPIIVTDHDYVQGISLTNNNGLTYYAFRGIPYALPPTGSRRFMKPEAPYAWPGILDASVEPPRCYQYNNTNPPAQVGTEDCLYLNVYIPELPDASNETKAVMVYIYGGAFQFGDSDEAEYGSGKLMGYDVITVTVNYRVGSLGFLSTGDDVIPGNYGLWDLVQALKWVQDNIAYFGGDSTKVTIFGESAGAFAVSSLFLSPQTEGLFHAAIAESGNLVTPFMYHPNPLPFARQLADHLNCPSDNSTLILSCLQNKTAKELYDAQAEFDANPTLNPLYFLPSVDAQVSEGLLPDQPINLIRNGLYNKVPYLAGLNYNEGIGFYEAIVSTGVIFDSDYITNNLQDLVRNYTTLTGDELTQVTSLIYDEYFSEIDLDNNTAIADGVQAVVSDILFNTGIFLMMTELRKGDDYPAIYTYVFTYLGEYLAFPEFGQTTHTDELVYLFDEEADNGGLLNAQDNVTSQRMLTLWTTFAKTGNPNPSSGDVVPVTWEPVTSSNSIPYLKIDTELSMEEDFRWERMEFWNSTILPIVFSNLLGNEFHQL